MILVDAGPLVALVNRRDPYHERCHAVVRTFPRGEVLLTTLPCFTEAMYMVGEAGGYRAQALLWELRSRGDLLLHAMTDAEIDRAEGLMEKFNDSPMDLATLRLSRSPKLEGRDRCSLSTGTSGATAWPTATHWSRSLPAESAYDPHPSD